MEIKTERGWVPLTHLADQNYGLFAKPIITWNPTPAEGDRIGEPFEPPYSRQDLFRFVQKLSMKAGTTKPVKLGECELNNDRCERNEPLHAGKELILYRVQVDSDQLDEDNEPIQVSKLACHNCMMEVM